MPSLVDADPWPELLMRERILTWSPDFQNEHSSPTLGGIIQVRNSNGGGFWRARLDTVQLRNKSQLMAWQAEEVRLQGGLGPVELPAHFCGQPPWPLDDDGDPITTVPPGGFGDGFPNNPIIRIRVSEDVAARAVVVPVVIDRGDFLVNGVHFSYYDPTLYGWRLYRVVMVLSGSGGYNLTIWPPLRTALAADTVLQFMLPRCVMKLASSSSMDLPIELRRRADPSADFVEADYPPEEA